ncbi:MAG: hypothetical protein ABW071_05015 [Casimicrobiaceae bacterium]
MNLFRACTAAAAAAACTLTLINASPAVAAFHEWRIDEIYSNASGSVQFIDLKMRIDIGGEQFVGGHSIVVTQGATTHSFVFPTNLPGDSAGADRHFLIATQGFADLGIVMPDFIVPDGFLTQPGGTVNYGEGTSIVNYMSLPTDGTHSLDASGNSVVNSPKNYGGQTGTVTPAASTAIALENPQPGSSNSGIGLVSGWSCEGPAIGVSLDGAAPVNVPYGSSRADTAGVCGQGNINTGFGLLLNFNLMGAGTHSAQLFVNGAARGPATMFTVTVPAGEFLTGVSRQVTVTDFPSPGRTTVLVWQQSQQNFVIQSVSP